MIYLRMRVNSRRIPDGTALSQSIPLQPNCLCEDRKTEHIESHQTAFDINPRLAVIFHL